MNRIAEGEGPVNRPVSPSLLPPPCDSPFPSAQHGDEEAHYTPAQDLGALITFWSFFVVVVFGFFFDSFL
jgi:hypothetical protein